MTFRFEIEPALRDAAPDYTLLAIEAQIENPTTSDSLWLEIENAMAEIRATYPMEQIRLRPAIDATRRAYKALGKEPNRYRPSAEALCRRAVKDLHLYRSLAAIDFINLLSLKTGISIGGFDAGKISGKTLSYSVGRLDEPYEAIGRGQLNIQGLPVWRDSIGGIGTPTSDNARTCLEQSTSSLLMTVNFFHPASDAEINEFEEEARRLLSLYCRASEISSLIAR